MGTQALKETLDQLSKSTATSGTPVNFEREQYRDVELDEDEIEEGLRRAREDKFYFQKRMEYNKQISEEQKFKSHSAEQLFEFYRDVFVSQKIEPFVSEAHESQIKQLCCYFAGDPRYRGELSKGILILGSIGNGKTTLMKMFQSNQNHSYRLVNMLDVTADYKMHGEEGVKCYNVNYTGAANLYGRTQYGYCFDEIGTEEIPARHYAETKNVFAEILQVRYNNGHKVPFNSTHVTTNKNEKDILEIYGSRAYDRMKEMFNVVVFEHGSFRGISRG